VRVGGHPRTALADRRYVRGHRSGNRQRPRVSEQRRSAIRSGDDRGCGVCR
jgi:hypothetical protein